MTILTAPAETSSDLQNDWKSRLEQIVTMMREMSLHTDPQAMVRSYGARLRKFMQFDRTFALSRRDLTPPKFRITRSSLWDREINPWTEKAKLPLFEGGLFGELIYGDQPRIIDDLVVDPNDPVAHLL